MILIKKFNVNFLSSKSKLLFNLNITKFTEFNNDELHEFL